MTKLTSNIKQPFTDALFFIGFYFITFLLLIGSFSDRSDTTAMFILIDFFVVAITIIYYLIATFIIKLTSKTVGMFATALLLFVLAELSVLTLTGELPLFGLLQKYIYSKNPYSADKPLDKSIYFFRQRRDFAFSMAGSTSAILFVIIKRRTKNSRHQQVAS